MITEIDASGFSCPQPVLMFVNACKNQPDNEFDVLVDNEASKENVSRAAENRGFNVEALNEKDDIIRLKIRKS